YLSVRNLPHVDVTEIGGLDPVSLLKYKDVVVTKDALQAIEEWLQ
ncbi:MAG: 50S ribosomal protein L4, partial [Gammaproteobacteria bacterium]